MDQTPPLDAPAAPGGFSRFLYRCYTAGAAANFFISRRLRPTGVALGFALILIGGLAIGHRHSSVYQAFSFCAGMTLIALPWAFSRRARVEVKRRLPAYATAGEKFSYTYQVKNTSRRTLRRAWLSETPPDPRPTHTEFSLLREPGEHERNAFDRVFAFYRWRWLLMKRRLFEGGFSRDALELDPGEERSMVAEMIPLRRGVIQLNDLRVLLPDPFGLFQSCRRTRSLPATLSILPKRYPLPPLEMPGSARFQVGGDSNTNQIGNSGEFVGLRDYRPGDPLRQIHWRSWARYGRPVVKELEDTFYPRYGLVLDTFPAKGNSPLFEDAISVAASFVTFIDQGEPLLDLMFIEDRAHVITAGRGMARPEKLLEVLAAVEADPAGDFDALLRLVRRHREALTSCVLVFAGWDHTRARFLTTLQSTGLPCAAIIVGEGPAPMGIPGHWVESGHLARDLRALPLRLGARI